MFVLGPQPSPFIHVHVHIITLPNSSQVPIKCWPGLCNYILYSAAISYMSIPVGIVYKYCQECRRIRTYQFIIWLSMEELDDGLLIYSNNANFVADSFLLDDLWVFSKEGLGGSVLGGSNSGQKNTILDSGKCSYIAQPNSDILPFSTLEDAETGLEWLSTFEDSSCASDIAGNSGESPQKQSLPESKHISFNMVIPCRARSKRTRFQLHPSKSLDTSSTTTQKPQFQVQYAEQNQEKEEEKSKLKKVKRKAVKGRESNGAQPRRCTHCQTQKTPQWRQGPLGPKTLCNACGVRFKTGRLYPEYRPAKSPSFVNYLHSNSHKKVLEMRTVGIGCGIRMHDLPAASAAALHILHHHSFSFC